MNYHIFKLSTDLGLDMITKPNPSDSFRTNVMFSLVCANSILSDPFVLVSLGSFDLSECSEYLTKILIIFI